jgi:hypothetical protein
VQPSQSLSLNNQCKIPRTELVSARPSWPLSNIDGHHDVWLCAILVQFHGNQRNRHTTVDNDHGQKLVPAALTDGLMEDKGLLPELQQSTSSSLHHLHNVSRDELDSAKSMTAAPAIVKSGCFVAFSDTCWSELGFRQIFTRGQAQSELQQAGNKQCFNSKGHCPVSRLLGVSRFEAQSSALVVSRHVCVSASVDDTVDMRSNFSHRQIWLFCCVFRHSLVRGGFLTDFRTSHMRHTRRQAQSKLQRAGNKHWFNAKGHCPVLRLLGVSRFEAPSSALVVSWHVCVPAVDVAVDMRSNFSVVAPQQQGQWWGVGVKVHSCMAEPAPSSHCDNQVMTLCAVTLLPRRHKCVARIAAMLSLAFTHPHACEWGFCHFPASFAARRFAKVSE